MQVNDLEFALMNNRVRAGSQRALETPVMIGARGALRGKRVLEVGCGRGVGVEILLEQLGAAEVVAFDFDPRMVDLARERVARFGERARVFVGDVEQMELPDASFDAVVEFGILHHVPNWRSALAEIARVLKPNGVFYFEDLLKGFVGAPLIRDLLDHPQATQFTGAEFRHALAEQNLLLDENWRQFAQIGLLGRATRVEQVTASIEKEFRLPLRVHSWYGVNAIVRGAGSLECDLVVEGKEFPHPSLVNLFIRRGLTPEARLRLGAWHEFGHLQALPFVALYALTLFAASIRHPRHWIRKFLAALIGVEATWELASESYVIAQVGTREYRRAYAQSNARMRLGLFWLGSVVAVLAVSVTLLGLERGRIKNSSNH